MSETRLEDGGDLDRPQRDPGARLPHRRADGSRLLRRGGVLDRCAASCRAQAVGAVMEAMLVASIDHGVTPPSTLAVRNAAADRCAAQRLLGRGRAGGQPPPRRRGGELHEAACARCRAGRRRVESTRRRRGGSDRPRRRPPTAACPGSGTASTPTTRAAGGCSRSAREAGVAGAARRRSPRPIVAALAKGGKKLPLNVDGAIAAVLADLGFSPELANGFFILARTAGLDGPRRRGAGARAADAPHRPVCRRVRRRGAAVAVRGRGEAEAVSSLVRKTSDQKDRTPDCRAVPRRRIDAMANYRIAWMPGDGIGNDCHGGDAPRARRVALRRDVHPRGHRLGVLVPRGRRPARRAPSTCWATSTPPCSAPSPRSR